MSNFMLNHMMQHNTDIKHIANPLRQLLCMEREVCNSSTVSICTYFNKKSNHIAVVSNIT